MKGQPVQPSFTFLIESSPSSIYRRITTGYRDALERRGHQVIYFDPTQYPDFEHALNHYIEILKSQTIDYFVIFDNSPLSSFYLKELNRFVFEESLAFLIFIHHDNIWSSFTTTELETGHHPLEAWRRTDNRSIHFCLEYSNFIDLKIMGFSHAHPIFHGSEFEKINPPETYTHDVSFVGHVLPGIGDVFERFEHLDYSHLIAADFWLRLASLDRKIAPSAVAYASRGGKVMGHPEFIQQRSLYQYTVSLLSTSFRGEILKRLATNFKIDIIGGDPGYLSGISTNRLLTKENISYHPPTDNYRKTQAVYSSSKINLNITGIQFDDAVVNRVIDAGSSGGFILTDRRTDLSKITTVSEAISYQTIDELLMRRFNTT
ncbi:glycosyltransferase family protein [Leptothermofonsia sp. ETS-13]|uniref:glycosyltransferase family protein n=1 Tax=Leptothermofonsia sp. ETS-13 TaxID=3035696 RepID=UPI003BA36784